MPILPVLVSWHCANSHGPFLWLAASVFTLPFSDHSIFLFLVRVAFQSYFQFPTPPATLGQCLTASWQCPSIDHSQFVGVYVNTILFNLLTLTINAQLDLQLFPCSVLHEPLTWLRFPPTWTACSASASPPDASWKTKVNSLPKIKECYIDSDYTYDNTVQHHVWRWLDKVSKQD